MRRWLLDIWESHGSFGSARAAVLEPWPRCHGNEAWNEGLPKVSFLLSEARSFIMLYAFFVFFQSERWSSLKTRWCFFPLAYRAPTYVPGLYQVHYMISFHFHNSLKQLGSIKKCISVRVQAAEESHSRYFSRKGVNTEILNIWQGSKGQ